ncbi:serine hydrolase [Variovorax sp. OV329]|uniref:serine hydrolase domain-containing protein n=1 Tax=Variovorax sp. OV329 TaxID=1882825 RepID=UPI0008EC91B5|nr:serine hydrolase [Variovorax sp. OV329]SFN34363.1 CubicO group peptidase, beta-lactamase class C family [Variovorax sp. OV329]
MKSKPKLRSRCALLALALACSSSAFAQWRASTSQEQSLDALAFQGIEQAIGEDFPDVQSVVVALRGRLVFQYYRDGNPESLRQVQSVAKSALSTLVGIAMQRGHIKSLDQPVVELLPQLLPLNTDPRSRDITLRHLLTMTAGFPVDDPTGTAPALAVQAGWARPISSSPGTVFAYDNTAVNTVAEILRKTTGMPVPDFARQQLVTPLGMAEPSYQRGLSMRTLDMAKLGQLALQDGRWGEMQLLSPSFVADATTARNAGGKPVALPYGLMWWVVPSKAPRPTFLASGFSGQFVWVYPGMQMVVATTSTVSMGAQERGQALQLMRTRLYAAAQKRETGTP